MATYYVNKTYAISGNGKYPYQASTVNGNGAFNNLGKALNATYIVSSGNDTIEVTEGTGPYYGPDMSGSRLYTAGITGNYVLNLNGNTLQCDTNVNTADYKWNRSTSPEKSDLFYLTTPSGGNPALAQIRSAIVNGYWSCESCNLLASSIILYGHYATDNWLWGDFDSLGFNTLYILHDRGTDPTGGEPIWVPKTNDVVTISPNTCNLTINDGIIRGGNQTGIVANKQININNVKLYNIDQQGINILSSAANGSRARHSIFDKCGHRGILINANASIEAYSNHFSDVHLALYLYNDSEYTVTARNNTSYNLLAGAVQHDKTLPELIESHNQWHLDPASTHAGNALSFTTATRRWTQTSPTDLPASTSTAFATSVDPLLAAGHHLQPASPCIGAGTKIPGITTDIEGNPLFPPYNIGPYGLAEGALGVAPVANDGPPRNNITQLTGASTTIDPAGTYKFADTKAARDATGFVCGVDHWAFTSTGIPKEILGSVLIANGGGDQFFCGSKRIAGYSSVQVEPSLTKIKRLTGV